jgi:enoyl-CoA hydratase/3-hydroxyacyl-CoA dehydrogenase
MALGGGLEIAIRCHSIIAKKNASFQFPEITLGILPGIGGCVVPYRKWPQAALTFHEMLRLGKMITAQEAQKIGMVNKIADDYFSMIKMAIEEVDNLQGKIPHIPEGPITIPPLPLLESPRSGNILLSLEAISILDKTIIAAAAAPTFAKALEIGYQGFGAIACLDAAREGITAFQERRQPNFKK